MTDTDQRKATAALLGCLASSVEFQPTQVMRATGMSVTELFQATLEMRSRHAQATGVSADQVDLRAVARKLVGRA